MRLILQARVACLLLTLAGCAGSSATNEAHTTTLSPQEFAESELISGLPWETSERSDDGGLFYDAYFNSVNGRLLRAPVRTLRSYCEGKGGKLAERKPLQVSAKALSAEPVPEEVEAALSSAGDAFGRFDCEEGGQTRWSALVEPKALLPVGEAPNWKLRMHVRASEEPDAEAEVAPAPAAEAAAANAARRDVRAQDELAEDEPSAGADAPRATRRSRGSCESGDLAQCLPEQRYRSLPLPSPRGAATFSIASRACARGKASACVLAAASALRGEAGRPADPELAAHLLQRGCSRGSADACAHYAAALEAGEGTRKDLSRALRDYTLACRKGNAVACNNAGAIVARGERSQRSTARGSKAAASVRQHELKTALTWFLRSCSHREAVGCANAGAAYLEGGAKNQKTAERYLHRACDGGDKQACRTIDALQ